MFDRRRAIRVYTKRDEVVTISSDNNWNYDSTGIHWEDDKSRFFMPWTSAITIVQDKEQKPDIRNYELPEDDEKFRIDIPQLKLDE